MNYLAHFALAHHTSTSFIGALLGDFVKGDDWQGYSADVQTGILLHRQVDSFTDHHPAVINLLEKFPSGTRRFAPIALDVYFDNQLSNHWHHYHPRSLAQVIQTTYQHLMQNEVDIPHGASLLSLRIAQQDWLSHYHHWEYCDNAIKHIEKRFRKAVNLTPTIEACGLLHSEIEQCFAVLYPDLLKHVEHTALKLKSHHE